MLRTSHHLKAMGRACRGRDSAMAHRRPLLRRRYLRTVLAGLGLALVIAVSVVVSTEVTRLRAQVGELEDRSSCLEAEAAELASRWMEASGPEVILARAAAELDLVQPAEPDFVLVAAPGRADAGDGFLQRMLAGFGGGATANAAQPPVFISGEMVSLDPAALDGAGDGATP